MPIYDYGCKACGHEFTREQRISDAPVKKCPQCGKLQAKRLISKTSFVLKGSGWYNDLYSSGKPKADTKSDDASAEKPAENKADDKPSKKSNKKDKGSKEAAA